MSTVRAGLAAALLVAACGRENPAPNGDTLATWQNAPLPPARALADKAMTELSCRSGLDESIPLTLVLQDQRTAQSAAFLVTAPGDWNGSCLVAVGGGASGGGGGANRLAPMQAAISVDERSFGGVGLASATLLGGRAAEGVASVEITLADGAVVHASVGNGHWLAWWPGGTDAALITASDMTGAGLASLEDSTPGFQQK
jgi:hypothetical protein